MIKEYFSKFNKKALIAQTITDFISIVLCQFGIGCYYTAQLGTDPISVFVEGISFHCNLTVGQISTICNVILTVLLFLFLRKQLGINTFLTVFFAGPLIDVFNNLLQTWFNPNETTFFVKCILLFIGLIVYSFGLGLCVSCDLGVGPFSFPPLFLEKVSKISIKYTQIITDAIFFIIGLFLGGIVNFGSIISVLCTGPLLAYTMKLIKPKLDSYGSIKNS